MNILFTDYRILWDKRKKTPKRDKVAIKADLETISKAIEEAMIYARNKAMEEHRETEVRYWLKTNTPFSYFVSIHYDSGLKAWGFFIQVASETDEIVGEIVSDKWPSLHILQDEDVEVGKNPSEHAQITKHEKIRQMMRLVDAILEGAVEVSRREDVVKAGWAGRIKGSAKKLKREMRVLAQRGDIDGMRRYYYNALNSFFGRRVAVWLKKYHKKSLESERDRMEKIYHDS